MSPCLIVSRSNIQMFDLFLPLIVFRYLLGISAFPPGDPGPPPGPIASSSLHKTLTPAFFCVKIGWISKNNDGAKSRKEDLPNITNIRSGIKTKLILFICLCIAGTHNTFLATVMFQVVSILLALHYSISLREQSAIINSCLVHYCGPILDCSWH